MTVMACKDSRSARIRDLQQLRPESGKKEIAESVGSTIELTRVATSYQLPATSYRLPATSYRLPATGYRLPATTKRSSWRRVPSAPSSSTLQFPARPAATV